MLNSRPSVWYTYSMNVCMESTCSVYLVELLIVCVSTDRSPSPSVLSTSSHEFEDHPLFLPHSQSTQSLTQHGRRLEFWYVSPEGQQVHYKDQAAVTFNGESSKLDQDTCFH